MDTRSITLFKLYLTVVYSLFFKDLPLLKDALLQMAGKSENGTSLQSTLYLQQLLFLGCRWVWAGLLGFLTQQQFLFLLLMLDPHSCYNLFPFHRMLLKSFKN